MSKVYENKLVKLKEEQANNIIPVLTNIYKVENFLNSKEVVFLNENKDKRLKPLVILKDFQEIKNSFSNDNKSIICDNVTINSDSILNAECTAFAA
jgi:hypothetical protein